MRSPFSGCRSEADTRRLIQRRPVILFLCCCGCGQAHEGEPGQNTRDEKLRWFFHAQLPNKVKEALTWAESVNNRLRRLARPEPIARVVKRQVAERGPNQKSNWQRHQQRMKWVSRDCRRAGHTEMPFVIHRNGPCLP